MQKIILEKFEDYSNPDFASKEISAVECNKLIDDLINKINDEFKRKITINRFEAEIREIFDEQLQKVNFLNKINEIENKLKQIDANFKLTKIYYSITDFNWKIVEFHNDDFPGCKFPDEYKWGKCGAILNKVVNKTLGYKVCEKKVFYNSLCTQLKNMMPEKNDNKLKNKLNNIMPNLLESIKEQLTKYKENYIEQIESFLQTFIDQNQKDIMEYNEIINFCKQLNNQLNEITNKANLAKESLQ